MFSRFAIYFVPEGPWGNFGARWLGWDSRIGQIVSTASEMQSDLTDRPRKYGFHATMKPPFHLEPGRSVVDLAATAAAMCAQFDPFELDSLNLAQIGRFFALTAPGQQSNLSALAAKAVRELDHFRAPLTETELERRRKSRLSGRQDELLVDWGYPYVLDEFRFHLTLTGPVHAPGPAKEMLDEALAPLFETPLRVDSLSLLGEAQDGRFHQIQRFPFGG